MAPGAGSRRGRTRPAAPRRRPRRATGVARARPGSPEAPSRSTARTASCSQLVPGKTTTPMRGATQPAEASSSRTALLDDRVGQQAVGHHGGLVPAPRPRRPRRPRSGTSGRPGRGDPVEAQGGQRPLDGGPSGRRCRRATGPRPAPRRTSCHVSTVPVVQRAAADPLVGGDVARRHGRPRPRRAAVAGAAACPRAGPPASRAGAACRRRAGLVPGTQSSAGQKPRRVRGAAPRRTGRARRRCSPARTWCRPDDDALRLGPGRGPGVGSRHMSRAASAASAPTRSTASAIDVEVVPLGGLGRGGEDGLGQAVGQCGARPAWPCRGPCPPSRTPCRPSRPGSRARCTRCRASRPGAPARPGRPGRAGPRAGRGAPRGSRPGRRLIRWLGPGRPAPRTSRRSWP
jgi:hypothetical protein